MCRLRCPSISDYDRILTPRKLLSCDHDLILRAHYEIALANALANAFANVFALVNAFAIVLANCDCACDDALGHHTLAL